MVHAGCVFAAGIHPSRTWMSGSFESVRWNACVHRLDLGLYSHPKGFWGKESEPMLTPKEKNPLYRKKNSSQRRTEPTTLHQAGLGAQHTTNWAIPAPKAGIDPRISRSRCRRLITRPPSRSLLARSHLGAPRAGHVWLFLAVEVCSLTACFTNARKRDFGKGAEAVPAGEITPWCIPGRVLRMAVPGCGGV